MVTAAVSEMPAAKMAEVMVVEMMELMEVVEMADGDCRDSHRSATIRPPRPDAGCVGTIVG